jgi:hypothetical protein
MRADGRTDRHDEANYRFSKFFGRAQKLSVNDTRVRYILIGLIGLLSCELCKTSELQTVLNPNSYLTFSAIQTSWKRVTLTPNRMLSIAVTK